MSTNGTSKKWKFLGRRSRNHEVADLLNESDIGSGATVSISASKEEFVVWGNADGERKTGHLWRALGERGAHQEVADLLQAKSALESVVSVNSNSDFVVWAYVPVAAGAPPTG